MADLKIPTKELNFTFSRSSGPGGQNVNKVNSKVHLRWQFSKTTACSKAVIERFSKKYEHRIYIDGVIVITSQRFRQQARNIADCIEKLHEMLNSVAKPPKRRRPTKPTKSSVEKRLKNKKAQSDKKKSRQSH